MTRAWPFISVTTRWRSVLGSLQSVEQLTVDQMCAYFTERYCPNNITVAVAGNVSFDRFVELIDDRCGQWAPGLVERSTPRARSNTDVRVYPNDVATLQYVVQTANGPAAEDEDRHAARILSTVIGDDTGSRLFWDLVDPGLAECAVMYSAEYQGTGIYSTMLCCEPEDAANNTHRINLVLRDVQDNGVTPVELEQACNKICSQIVLQSERPANRLFSFGNAWLQRHEYRSVREMIDAYRAVTCEDVRRVLERFPVTVFSTVAVGPLRELVGGA